MKLEVNSNFFDVTGKYVSQTPQIGKSRWYWRVHLFGDQYIVGFPKFGMIGIGFAVEEDLNTNLPYTCEAATIYQHISRNKKYLEIKETDCIEAIKMLQVVASRYMEEAR